ncbi:hypothetical protein EGT74_11000 [Chitinophaga lutea]|uniref:Cytochrome c domain-containing protein n=2 Tax=Chitinophaga lutea TaxID=2488634 RepID=A0A3N4Q196_9BACT|nr:hypothetical protein EGT74_11000 [Chitinophaga lutea]
MQIMKTLVSVFLMATLLWACSPGLNPENTAKVEEAFAKYEDSPGKTVFRDKCAKCHGYRLPETRLAEKWPKTIDKMAPKAKLTDDQKAAVLAFVTKYAKAS